MSSLLVGYKASELSPALLAGEVTCHVLDIYLQHAIEKVFPGTKVVCSAHLPSGPWARIRFRTGPKLMSGEVALSLLQEIAQLTGGDLSSSRFELDYVGKERDRNELLAKVRDDPGRVRDFAAVWPASVPGGRRLLFTSYPGCFCHRRLDEGGLALAEVVCRELKAAGDAGRALANLKLLDMGCGCGLVGLLVADYVRSLAGSPLALTLVDSHTRAIEAATVNAAKLSVEAEICLSDDGVEHPGAYDLFVGNPPYYSDYRIAEVFLATAQRTLKSGGVCYSVCKNAQGLEPVQRKFFPQVEVIRRRGYAVLKSVKE